MPKPKAKAKSSSRKYKAIEPTKYDRRRHIISFRNAWNGIRLAYETQPNFRIHTLAFFLAMLFAIYFRISIGELTALLVVSALVFSMEMFNTVVEAIGDEIAHGKYNKLVGVAKDVAAGGVLISAAAALLVGILIFVPKIFEAGQYPYY